MDENSSQQIVEDIRNSFKPYTANHISENTKSNKSVKSVKWDADYIKEDSIIEPCKRLKKITPEMIIAKSSKEDKISLKDEAKS